MQPLRAVLFDVGDTLFERRGGSGAIVDAARELGVRVDGAVAATLWSDIQARARTPEELARGRDLSPEAHRSAWTDLYRPAEALAEGLAGALYEREIGPDHWSPFPDAAPTLEALAEREVPVGVVSDVGFDLRPFFERCGLLDLVGSFVLSYEHGAAKPARVLFETACAELGVAPEATVMVGDNPLTDGGAVGAGLACLLLPPVHPGRPRGLERVLGLLD
ncbi:MAG TPA: HAD-IA family hydrolase [Actinomycetes bacterium]|jgi:putative hydrolase of the HAD superfamily|nr:HAD-IA family hydrolase [Actinomycetes bacterium]